MNAAPDESPASSGSGPVAGTTGIAHAVSRVRLGMVVILFAALLWAYWPVVQSLVNRWTHNPTYSHGYLVPLFAAYLLWRRRARLATASTHWSWLGVLFLGLGTLSHLVGTWFYVEALSGLALVASITGLLVVLGGRATFAWAWPACAFLGFMLPLPYRLETALGQPLQRMATNAGTYCLQTLGFPAVAEGNVIIVNDLRMGVEGACNGLAMLIVFIAISVAVALVINRPWWERAVILVSAVPIALIANIVRITMTTIAFQVVGKRASELVFHDLAGWLMMPVALIVMLFELWILSRLLIDDPAGDAAQQPAVKFTTREAAPKPKRQGRGTWSATPDGASA